MTTQLGCRLHQSYVGLAALNFRYQFLLAAILYAPTVSQPAKKVIIIDKSLN